MRKTFVMANLLSKRFAELVDQLHAVEATRNIKQGETRYIKQREMMGDAEYVDQYMLLNWTVKAEALLEKVCGKDAKHTVTFRSAQKLFAGQTNVNSLQKQKAVFLAAQEDYDGGYLSSVRSLVQAEVFDSELEQAEELFRGGYHLAAAVIAGVVLETCIREICTHNSVAHSKLDKMNADLAKAGVYTMLVQKRVTALAHVRNAAAHGDAGAFTSQDVSEMIEDVRRFITDNGPS